VEEDSLLWNAIAVEENDRDGDKWLRVAMEQHLPRDRGHCVVERPEDWISGWLRSRFGRRWEDSSRSREFAA